MTPKPQKMASSSQLKGERVHLDPMKHPVYYRASQVGLSAPCLARPALKVGMRVAILENREEFTGQVPAPLFYAAVVESVGDGADPLVRFRYENQPNVIALTVGMNNIAHYCVVLPLKRVRASKRSITE